MPVSHLGLTVSHIPSATSFYLSALQPLGYRFIGQQGDSIGLGIDSADFFLTQAPVGTRPSPNHIAFLAESRLIVRDCYAAGLTSGGLPSGAPSYRNDDCSCFNAAVEDLDGNTVEFIFRQPHGQNCCHGQSASSEGSNLLDDDARSAAQSVVSRRSLAPKTSRAKSQTQTALDLASTTSKSAKSTGLNQSARSNDSKSDFPSKTLIGTALGAAAGAALMYAMTKSESENAREEADHLAYMNAKSKRDHDEQRPPTAKADTSSQAPRSETRKFHRNYSTTESAHSKRQPPFQTNVMRMIEATGYNRDDEDVQEALSRYQPLRPKATRSRTYDDYDYAPVLNAPRSAVHSGHSMKRAGTMPTEQADRPNYFLEAPPAQNSMSRHGTRHEASPKSTVSASSRHTHRRSSADDQNLKRHDSGISVHSHRSRRERENKSDRRSSTSKASTIKPSRRKYDNVADITADIPLAQGSRAASSCYHPAAISLPPSKVSSRLTNTERERSYVSSKALNTIQATPNEPLVPSKESWEDFVAEESDGMGDIKTVLPEDSISMVDLTKPRSKNRSKHASSQRSEASTVKPLRKEKESSTMLAHRSRKGREERRNVHDGK